MARNNEKEVRCSFCGKPQSVVDRLIAGQEAFICGDCIGLCYDLVHGTMFADDDDMDFDAALLAVQQGKSDMVMAGVTVTDERQNVMDFTDSYATGIQSIIVKEDSDIASVDDLAGK